MRPPSGIDRGPRATHFDRHCGRSRGRRGACPGTAARRRAREIRPHRPRGVASRHRRRARRGGVAARGAGRGPARDPTDRVRAGRRAHGRLSAVRQGRDLHRRTALRPRSEPGHVAHPAARRGSVRRRLVLGAARSVPRSAQRLSLHDESQRPAPRGTLPEHQRGAVGLGRHLVHGLDDRRARLGHGDRDSVQDAVVQSRERHVGHQLPPRDRAARRAHGLGFAQPQLRSQHLGHRRGARRARARHGARRRAVAVRQRAAAVRRHGRDDRHRAVARRVLQAHAELDERADDQHRLLGHRGRRPAGQPDALRPVLSREARLLPAGRRHLRVRRPGAERPAVLLAPHRLERRRRADRPRGRRQDHGPRGPLEHRRAERAAGRVRGAAAPTTRRSRARRRICSRNRASA